MWCCGDMHYFERKIINDLWDAIINEAQQFFLDVKNQNEGDPFGEPVEMPLMQKIFEVTPAKVVDLSQGENAYKLAEDVRLWATSRNERLLQEKTEKALKAKFAALMKDAEEATFVNGIKIHAKRITRAGYNVRPSAYTQFEAYVPGDLPDELTR